MQEVGIVAGLRTKQVQSDLRATVSQAAETTKTNS
jgi:hypothetical protein